jgi:hypothetical protein
VSLFESLAQQPCSAVSSSSLDFLCALDDGSAEDGDNDLFLGISRVTCQGVAYKPNHYPRGARKYRSRRNGRSGPPGLWHHLYILPMCNVVCIRYIRPAKNTLSILTHNRPSCDTIREEEKVTICLDSFPHSDCGCHDACHLRCNSSIRPQPHHLQAMSSIHHSLPIFVLFFKDSAVSNS